MTNVAKSYKTNGTMDIQAVIQPGTSHYVLQWSGGGSDSTSTRRTIYITFFCRYTSS
jgi:hypothetical protein